MSLLTSQGAPMITSSTYRHANTLKLRSCRCIIGWFAPLCPLMVRSVWIPTSKKSPNCLAAFSVCGNSNTNTVFHMITCSTTSQNCSFTLLYHYHHCHGQFDSTVFNNIAGNNHCMLKKKWKLTICIRTIHHHL
jgi:hypothetical protein